MHNAYHILYTIYNILSIGRATQHSLTIYTHTISYTQSQYICVPNYIDCTQYICIHILYRLIQHATSRVSPYICIPYSIHNLYQIVYWTSDPAESHNIYAYHIVYTISIYMHTKLYRLYTIYMHTYIIYTIYIIWYAYILCTIYIIWYAYILRLCIQYGMRIYCETLLGRSSNRQSGIHCV